MVLGKLKKLGKKGAGLAKKAGQMQVRGHRRNLKTALKAGKKAAKAATSKRALSALSEGSPAKHVMRVSGGKFGGVGAYRKAGSKVVKAAKSKTGRRIAAAALVPGAGPAMAARAGVKAGMKMLRGRKKPQARDLPKFFGVRMRKKKAMMKGAKMKKASRNPRGRQ